MKHKPGDRVSEALRIFEEHGGILRTGQALKLGIHPEIIYKMRDEGLLEFVTRGLYRLADSTTASYSDIVAVSIRVPQAVICMISALSFHGITTQIPHTVDFALPKGARKPRISYPPTRTYRFAKRIHECGVEEHHVDQKRIRVYSPERSLVDCFRFRNKVGLDTGIEALRLYRERKKVKVDKIMECARVCRAKRIVRPYLEGIL